VSRDGATARFAFAVTRNPQPVIAAVAARYAVADLSLEEPDLEAIIREIYRRGSAGPGDTPDSSAVRPERV
jgi:ABC-2 type transport system ATP-binding protein